MRAGHLTCRDTISEHVVRYGSSWLYPARLQQTGQFMYDLCLHTGIRVDRGGPTCWTARLVFKSLANETQPDEATDAVSSWYQTALAVVTQSEGDAGMRISA
jgi:hypothetical protein